MQHYVLPVRLLPVALLLVVASLLAACQSVQPPQPSAAAAALTPTAPPVVAYDAATDWQRIEESGRLIVGTAADYAPFEYYDQSFQLAGFDPALMRAIGAQLGVEVLFKDFALESLADALALGQIDVAAAALTVTPERRAIIDFSQPYFASTEGILAQADDAGSITKVADLAGKRIGVERGSIYESWLRSQLVDTGTNPAENLILYATVDDAVADLIEKRIDLIITDLPAAKNIAKAQRLQVASSGLLAQQYALGVRKGADELRAQLDAALATLAADGTLAQIARQELETDQLTPPGTLPATSGSAEPAASPIKQGCVDGLAWLEDLSLPDLGMTAPAVMAPGQAFSKAWRVLNTGTCPWDSSYRLVFAHGSPQGASMGGQPVAVSGKVEPGATYDLEAQLVAPVSAGVYQGAWQMQNDRGNNVGERLRVGIQVAGAPTPTPAPTQTPSPGIFFSADAERVLQGNPVNFMWDVQGAQEVYFYQAGQEWQNRAVEAQGSAADIPNATTTYNLRVVRNGMEEIRAVTVYVEPNPNLPQVSYFTLAPSDELVLGQCASIAWQVAGEVEQVAIFRNKKLLWEEAPVEGTYEDCPQTAGAYEYAVGAQGPGGRNYAVATLQVIGAAAAIQAQGTPEGGPTIDLFAVLPGQLAVGECAELRWTVGGQISNIRIERDGVVLVEGAPRSGSGTDCPSEPGLLRYSITAVGDQGQTDSAEAEVGVGGAEPHGDACAGHTRSCTDCICRSRGDG